MHAPGDLVDILYVRAVIRVGVDACVDEVTQLQHGRETGVGDKCIAASFFN